MATIEVHEFVFDEIKEIAGNFLDNAIRDPHYETTHPEDLQTIGLRIVEALYPQTYKEYFLRLCDAVKEDLKKEDK